MYKSFDVEYKEKTKIDNIEKIQLWLRIIMVVFSVIVAIKEKDATWIVVSLLWGNLAIERYFNAKIIKGRDYLEEIQDKHIKEQNRMLDDLIHKLSEKNVIIDLKNIKVPEDFTKPNKKKLESREKYFRSNSKFKVPIIIDSENNLVDGYTSYLIAKKYEFSTVNVIVKEV